VPASSPIQRQRLHLASPFQLSAFQFSVFQYFTSLFDLLQDRFLMNYVFAIAVPPGEWLAALLYHCAQGSS
jgi:hypothetical protein